MLGRIPRRADFVAFARPRRLRPPSLLRFVRYQAYDAGFDPGELSAARAWYRSFKPSSLPRGDTSYSRSSGPGGQHVNKTETKATTSWAASGLVAVLPKLLHARVRTSRYYSKRSDSITVQAQTQRSRSANEKENREKLFEELVRIYNETIPGESSPEKTQKHEAIARSFHENRIRLKKQQSATKQSRRGRGDGD